MADIWNLNALCRCCHKDGYFRSMQYPYVGKDGNVEEYYSWLKEVFDIQMVTPSVTASDMICEECITSLRDARTFKKQVTDCELRFQQYCRNETIVKIEIETDENMHSETDSKILQHFDVINSSPLKKHEDHKTKIKIETDNDQSDQCDNDNTDNFDNTDNNDNNDDSNSDLEPLAKTVNDRKGKRKVSNVKMIKSKVTKRKVKNDSKIAKCKTIKTEVKSTMTKKKITIKPKKQDGRPTATNTEANLWSCKLCGETKKNIMDLQKHMSKKHQDGTDFEDIKCQFCDDVVKGHDTYKQHIRTIHPDKGTVCNFCPEVYMYRAHLRDHYETCHSKGSGKYTCDTCQKPFYTKALIRNHVKLHMERVRRFMCSICSNQFFSGYHLNQHVQQVHHNLRQHQCELCPKTFKQKKTLRLHMRAKHTFERPYACDICGKRYIQKNEVTRHKLTHTVEYLKDRKDSKMIIKLQNKDGDTEEKFLKIYRCFLCKEGIGGRTAYRKHLDKEHHGMLPYQCHVCPRSFSSKYVLERHIYTHGDTEVKCETCSRVFKHETFLIAHRKRTCGTTKTTPTKPGFAKCDVCNFTVKNLEKHRIVHFVRPFKCHLCEKDFTLNNALQRHVKEVHLKLYNHSCDICSKKFVKSSTVIKHKEKKHPEVCQMKREVEADT